jgi:hypothetical protein
MEEIIATYLISSEKKDKWFGRMKIMGVIRLNLATI